MVDDLQLQAARRRWIECVLERQRQQQDEQDRYREQHGEAMPVAHQHAQFLAAEGEQGSHQSRKARSVNSRNTSSKRARSEEHTSELQSLMRISYAVFCLKKKT